MRTGRGVLATAALGLGLLGLTGCGSDKSGGGKPKKPPYVEAVAAEKTRLVEVLETTGNIVATNTVTLHATVEGPISFCPWREGDPVEEAGQKLIEIDRPLYRQEVSAAEAALSVARAKLADLKAGARPEEIAQARESVRHFDDCTTFTKADLDRTASLVESGALPAEMAEKARVSYIECQTQLGAAKERVAMLEAGPTLTEIGVAQAAVEEAAAKRDLAQAKRDECLLTAPFAGVITEVLVRPGDLARPQAPLLKMMDPSSLVVRAGLPESCAAHLHEGTEAVVRLDAYPQETFRARIERVYPRLEQDSRTRIIEAKVIDPAELIPHLSARLSVRGRVAEDAVVVPDAAVVTTPGGGKVVYVASGGKAQMRTVAIGLQQGHDVQITDGVRAGEMVVIAGNQNLKDGVEVRLGKSDAGAKQAIAREGEGKSGTDMEQVLLQGKFPVRLRKWNKSELRVSTLDEVCEYFRGAIEKHPFARYLGTFDHYAHTTGLTGGVVDSDVIGAKNIMFCFGKKIESPDVLSVRPRSIGVCETESQFVISFLEAPSAKATETMEQWVGGLAKPARSVENKQVHGGKGQ
jgi:multidrug efflux pump subunit AcrA (membrane-fusion protein)